MSSIERFTTAVVLLASACGMPASRGAARTLMGVGQDQAFVAAHRVLGERAYDFESVDRARGKLITEWRDQGLRSSRYQVTITPEEQRGAGESGAVRVEVVALARDRAVRGWTPGHPLGEPARRLAQDIADEVEESADAAAALSTAAAPACSASADCPPGQHCGSGRCVWECAADNECRPDEVCDQRGRCVTSSLGSLPPFEGMGVEAP
jgi:hypothetical protein